MEAQEFRQLVARLEQQSARSPALYQAKVAALALLGFGILALLLGAVGFGLLLLVGLVAAVAWSGGAALLLILKFAKVLWVLAIPLALMARAGARALFVRLPPPQGREITREEAPALFQALDRLRSQMKGPRFHHVLVVDEVNAAVVQRPAFGLIGWPRNYLLLGLPLLESLPAEEALAVVAHEYGHLAGSHSHFGAFIYRLRLSWGTVQAFAEQVQGWLGRLVAPVVRWYVPYFNAYTFVLARANEYQADAAAAELVGVGPAAHALKRVNLVGPEHQRFMRQTFDLISDSAAPPPDLMQRWAGRAQQPPPTEEARQWLSDALDREGHFTDSHPTLRARLAALHLGPEAAQDLPPALSGESAAQAWLGPWLAILRDELERHWVEGVAQPWQERHAEIQESRTRLATLRALPERTVDEQLEMLRLVSRLEPDTDLREPLAAFNAGQPDHPLGLFLEGAARLAHGDRQGLPLLERAMQLDPEATKPACEQAHAFLRQQKEPEAAEAYAERWRNRDALEAERARQLQTLDPDHALAPHGMPEETVAELQAVLTAPAREHIAEVHLARRIIPADPTAVQWVMGLKLTWWGRRRGKEREVVDRLSSLAWPMTLVFVTLDGRYARLEPKFKAIAGSRLA